MGNTIKAADLHRALTDVKPFMSKDQTVPMLCCVRIESANGNLVAVATDRFTLGASRADYTGEDFAATLSASSIDNLMRIAKTARRDADWRTVDIEVTGKELRFRFTSGESLTVLCEDSDFPRWRQLISVDRIDHTDQQAAMVGYNADYMARFSKVAGSTNMRLFSRGTAKPAVVSIGRDFVGLIMPVRCEDDTFSKPSWIV